MWINDIIKPLYFLGVMKKVKVSDQVYYLVDHYKFRLYHPLTWVFAVMLFCLSLIMAIAKMVAQTYTNIVVEDYQVMIRTKHTKN